MLAELRVEVRPVPVMVQVKCLAVYQLGGSQEELQKFIYRNIEIKCVYVCIYLYLLYCGDKQVVIQVPSLIGMEGLRLCEAV